MATSPFATRWISVTDMTATDPFHPRILVVTAMFPTASNPVFGIVVQREVERLRTAGSYVRVVSKSAGLRGYFGQAVHAALARSSVDVVHAHFGTSGFVAALTCGRRPLVVTLHGSDIAAGWRPRLSRYWIQYWLSIAGAWRASQVLVQDESMILQLPPGLRRKTVVLGQAVTLPGPRDRDLIRSGVIFLGDRRRVIKRFWLAESAVAHLMEPTRLDSLDMYKPSDVLGAMAAASVGLLTSEREGMPVAVKEALAVGLRVVAVDLPPLRELANDLPDVVTLTAHEASALAAALSRALKSGPLTAAELTRVHAVMEAKGWTEPGRTLRLQHYYRELAASGILSTARPPRNSRLDSLTGTSSQTSR
jgi:Glycosyltransferase Family 4/Glycosyl transferases group 1